MDSKFCQVPTKDIFLKYLSEYLHVLSEDITMSKAQDSIIQDMMYYIAANKCYITADDLDSDTQKLRQSIRNKMLQMIGLKYMYVLPIFTEIFSDNPDPDVNDFHMLSEHVLDMMNSEIPPLEDIKNETGESSESKMTTLDVDPLEEGENPVKDTKDEIPEDDTPLGDNKGHRIIVTGPLSEEFIKKICGSYNPNDYNHTPPVTKICNDCNHTPPVSKEKTYFSLTTDITKKYEFGIHVFTIEDWGDLIIPDDLRKIDKIPIYGYCYNGSVKNPEYLSGIFTEVHDVSDWYIGHHFQQLSKISEKL